LKPILTVSLENILVEIKAVRNVMMPDIKLVDLKEYFRSHFSDTLIEEITSAIGRTSDFVSK
jgi:hypothetical protein